jgi:hypothetical protein
MLRREPMAARHIRYDRAWRKGFRYDPSLDLVAPAPAPHRALWLRSVDYIPNHRCEPLCARRTTCGRPARRLQRGARRPLTVHSLRMQILSKQRLDEIVSVLILWLYCKQSSAPPAESVHRGRLLLVESVFNFFPHTTRLWPFYTLIPIPFGKVFRTFDSFIAWYREK